MITVTEALDLLFELAERTGTEKVALRQACGRVLAEDAVATRDQPPFAASAMDGYAVRSSEVAPGASFAVIGESAAGHRFKGEVQPGQAVRIFTGAPIPSGADRVVIQEDVIPGNARITLGETIDSGPYIRAAGSDFKVGSRIENGRLLSPPDIALLASMNIPQVVVHRKPRVAILATGDELVMPGDDPSEDQIISSNGFGLAALLEQAGAVVHLLPIASDTIDSLRAAIALAEGCDLIVTTGGASVGDHDLLGNAPPELGLVLDFYKVAMRPGKPLMAGRLGGTPMVGLPGNPVSSMICGMIFVQPMVRAMMGLPRAPALRRRAILAEAIPANGPREHYMRAVAVDGKVRMMPRQDSSLQSVLAQSNALLVRSPMASALQPGDGVDVILLND